MQTCRHCGEVLGGEYIICPSCGRSLGRKIKPPKIAIGIGGVIFLGLILKICGIGMLDGELPF